MENPASSPSLGERRSEVAHLQVLRDAEERLCRFRAVVDRRFPRLVLQIEDSWPLGNRSGCLRIASVSGT
jgi:hypothetical protein